jgi:hypothetical protein
MRLTPAFPNTTGDVIVLDTGAERLVAAEKGETRLSRNTKASHGVSQGATTCASRCFCGERLCRANKGMKQICGDRYEAFGTAGKGSAFADHFPRGVDPPLRWGGGPGHRVNDSV